MTLLLRFLPFLIALFEVGVFYLQVSKPLSYPWVILAGVIALPVAAFAISWRRLSLADMLEKMVPSFVLIATLAFALLLSEGPLAIWIVIILAAVSSFMSLELLFLLVYHPARYPVNGISRLNVAYVPPAVWYTAATSSGLLMFLHIDRAWHVVLMIALSAVLFRTTGHASATTGEKTAWTILGALVGLHVGLLGLLLPVSMPVQGCLAALLICVSLRARRYIHEPKLPPRQAWIEATVALIAFVVVLTTAKWL